MENKFCKSCEKTKELQDFYTSKYKGISGVSVYYNSICKDCYKIAIKNNLIKRAEKGFTVEQILKERDRQRKWKALSKNGQSIKKKEYYDKYKQLNKEKGLARQEVNNKIKEKLEKGIERHHWCYRRDFWLDIICIEKTKHRRLHRYLVYVKDLMIYKTIWGEMLDTKEKHLAFIEYIETYKDIEYVFKSK